MIRHCVVQECVRPYRSRGYCAYHYRLARQCGEIAKIPRKVRPWRDPDWMMRRIEYDTNGGCWLWRGGLNGQDYAVKPVNGINRRVHRLSYERFVGPIPTGSVICHKCDVRCCINPDHLYAGDASSNQRDRWQRRGRPPQVVAVIASRAQIADVEEAVNQGAA